MLRKDDTVNISPPNRRLDAVARLIAGGDACAAICFYDGAIIVANNEGFAKGGNAKRLLDDYRNYFVKVAKLDTQTLLSSPEISQEFNKLVDRSYKAVAERSNNELVKDNLAEIKKLEAQQTTSSARHEQLAQKIAVVQQAIEGYDENFKIAEGTKDEISNASKPANVRKRLNAQLEPILVLENPEILKSVNAEGRLNLAKDYKPKLEAELKKLQAELKENEVLQEKVAIQLGEAQESDALYSRMKRDLTKVTLSLVTDSKKDKAFDPEIRKALTSEYAIAVGGAHAEMKVIQEIYARNKDSLNLKQPAYIGISKLCCEDCGHVMGELGKKFTIKTDVEKGGKEITMIQHRGIHNNSYPGWHNHIPAFIGALGINVLQEMTPEQIELRKKSSKGNKEEPDLSGSDEELEFDFSKKETGKTGASTSKSKESSKKEKPDRDDDLFGELQKRMMEQPDFAVQAKIKLVAGGNRDLHVNDNAFNKYSDQDYWYQTPDINAIGRQLLSGKKNVVFAGAFTDAQNPLLNIETSLGIHKKSLDAGNQLVGAYRTGGNHWIAFKIIKGQDKLKNESIAIVYKDSAGQKREDFEAAVKKAFPDIKVSVTQLQPDIKEQKDGASCGVFALKNMEILAETETKDLTKAKYYTPASGKEIETLREEYAVKYAKTVHVDVVQTWKEIYQRHAVAAAHQSEAELVRLALPGKGGGGKVKVSIVTTPDMGYQYSVKAIKKEDYDEMKKSIQAILNHGAKLEEDPKEGIIKFSPENVRINRASKLTVLEKNANKIHTAIEENNKKAKEQKEVDTGLISKEFLEALNISDSVVSEKITAQVLKDTELNLTELQKKSQKEKPKSSVVPIALSSEPKEVSKLSNEELLSELMERGSKDYLLNAKIKSILISNTAYSNIFYSKNSGVDVEAAHNAFNKFQDQKYWYQTPDINAIGHELMKDAKGFVFVGAFTDANNPLLNMETSLEKYKGQVTKENSIVGAYRTSGNHWISYKVYQDGEGIKVVYKDSNDEQRKDFEEAIAKVFPSAKVARVQVGKQEQIDGSSCGLFALQNMVILGNTPNENLSDPKEMEKVPFYDPKTAGKNIQALREEFAELYAKMVFTEAKVIWVDTKKRQALCEAHQSEAKDIQGMLDENKVKATANIVSGEKEGYAYQIKINGYKNLESNQQKEEVKKLTEVVKKLTSENIEFDEKEGLVKILPSKLNVKSIDVSILKLKKEQNDRNGFNYKEPPPEVIAQEFFSALNIASKGGEIKPIYLEVLKRVCKNNNIPLDLQVMESMISVTEKPASKDVPKADVKDKPLKDSLGKEQKSEESNNLRRAEKEVLTNDIDAESQLGQKKKYSLNEKLLEYNNRVLGVESFLNTLEEQSKEASKSDFAVTHKMENSNKEKGSVSILSEANHHIDHAKNTQYLIEKIKSGAVTKDSVIALERKQDGVNLGMVDIIKIASILQHNEKNPDKQILIRDEIKKSEIYQDALLYKVATEHGISVIGVEGKKLDYNKESAHYNDARENHMIEIIDRLTSQGKEVILPLGSEHVENLQSKLGNKGIDAEIIAIEKTTEKRQEKQDSKPIIGKFTQMVSKDPSRMLVR